MGAEQTLDYKEAAERLGLSISTLERLKRKGKIGYCKQGWRVLFLERHLAEYLESIEVPAKRTN